MNVNAPTHASVIQQYSLVLSKASAVAGNVAMGLVESNESLLSDLWLRTCRVILT